jgi:hypothetical protein
MTKTIAKTYRMPASIHTRIVDEAEKHRTSEADIVRMALRQYFDDRQQHDALAASETRIVRRIDAQGERQVALISEILKLAQQD